MRTDTAIAKELPNLIHALKGKAHQNHEGLFAFVPQLLFAAEQLSSSMRLPKGEPTSAEKTRTMRELAKDIRNFIREFRTFHPRASGEKKAPDYCMRANKKIEAYFADFFRGFIAEPKEMTAAITKRIGQDPTRIAQRYASWLPLHRELDKRAVDAAHLARAYDLKLLLMGTLRLYGLTSAEIRDIMTGKKRSSHISH